MICNLSEILGLASFLFVPISAIASLAAAFAAWRSARASERNLKEAELARIQSAEPFLSISFPNPYFTIAWRPQTGEVPMVSEGWITSTYGVGGFEPIAMRVSNYGGGPALDLKIRVEALTSDTVIPDINFTDVGAAMGCELRWADGVLRGIPAQVGGRSEVRTARAQNDFAPACARDAPVDSPLASELLLRLLPTTMKLETNYFPRGTPADKGRVGWRVCIAYRTAISPEEKKICQYVYAERVRIDTLPAGSAEKWMEKFYRCELKVKPPDGFEITPNPVDAHAYGAIGTLTLTAPNGSAHGETKD
jgi:hypothetical protein